MRFGILQQITTPPAPEPDFSVTLAPGATTTQYGDNSYFWAKSIDGRDVRISLEYITSGYLQFYLYYPDGGLDPTIEWSAGDRSGTVTSSIGTVYVDGGNTFSAPYFSGLYASATWTITLTIGGIVVEVNGGNPS